MEHEKKKRTEQKTHNGINKEEGEERKNRYMLCMGYLRSNEWAYNQAHSGLELQQQHQ